jgi:hypothetical protein
MTDPFARSAEVIAKSQRAKLEVRRAELIRETIARFDLLGEIAKRAGEHLPITCWADDQVEQWELLKRLYCLVHWDALLARAGCSLPLPGETVWVRDSNMSSSGYTQWQRGVVSWYDVRESRVRMRVRMMFGVWSTYCHAQPLVEAGEGILWTTADPEGGQ